MKACPRPVSTTARIASSARAPVERAGHRPYMAASKALRTSGRSKAISRTAVASSSTSIRSARSRADHLAAVDVEDVAGDPRGLVGQQEQAHAHQVGGLALALEGQRRPGSAA